MLKIVKFYFVFVVLFEELRKECGITVAQLCSDSGVSTRTYAKFVKKTPIRFDCCIRLFIGCFKGATKEEIRDFLLKLLDALYDYYSEYDKKEREHLGKTEENLFLCFGNKIGRRIYE